MVGDNAFENGDAFFEYPLFRGILRRFFSNIQCVQFELSLLQLEEGQDEHTAENGKQAAADAEDGNDEGIDVVFITA